MSNPGIRTKPDHIEKQVQQQKLDLLYKQSLPATFISLAVSLLLVKILWSVTNHTILLSWLGTLFASTLLRGSIFYRYYHQKTPSNTEPNTDYWEKLYYYTLTLSVAIWGIGCTYIIAFTPSSHQFIIYFFLMGMVSGAISVYSSIRYIVLTTTMLLIVPATIFFLLSDLPSHFYAGLGSTFFILSFLRSSKIMSTTLHNSFVLSLELHQAKEALEKLAKTDFLTGLNNRSAFTELASQQIKYCQRHDFPVALILLDLDFFKKINDNYGHAAGDQALKELAKIMTSSVRTSDICGRIGGEEFAILLPNASQNDAVKVAEKIRKNIEHTTIHYQHKQFTMTTSIGVTSIKNSLEKMLDSADKALYQAKQNGRNQVAIAS